MGGKLMSKFKKNCVLFLCMTLLSLGFADAFAVIAASGYSDIYKRNIKVKLSEFSEASVDFKLQGSYSIDGTGIVIGDAAYTLKLDSGNLSLYKGSELINQFPIGANVSITSQNYDSNLLTLIKTNRQYMGHFDFINKGSYIEIVNKLGIEEYLYGVVPSEMFESDHPEALKAQAVASRSYAFFKMIGSTTYYDLSNDTYSQVYHGYSTSTPKSKAAVDSTKGIILTYNGKPIEALFSASNGGYTEKNGNVWSGQSLPYFDSAPDVNLINGKAYDANTWTRTFTSNKIKSMLSSSTKTAIGDFTSIDLNSITYYVSGRISNITLKGTAGTISFSREAARTSLSLPSALYTVSYDSSIDTYTFSGRGNGHGLGMSQTGAQNRALDGQTYSEILSFYYPNSIQANANSDVFASTQTVTLNGITPTQLNTYAGKQESITVSASGGNGLLYQYSIYNYQMGTWGMVQDYSANPILTWRFNESGKFRIICLIKDKTSSAYNRVAYCETTVNPPAAWISKDNQATGKLPNASSDFKNIYYITDGNIATESYADNYINSGLQWVQIDLGASYDINSIKLWHYFGDARKYHDVVVQLSNDPTFKTGVTNVYNNDANNSAGLGIGTDGEYAETSSGKAVTFNAVNARYARFYSNGNNVNNFNHYVEIEIYGSASVEVIHPTSVTLNKTADSIAIGSTDKLTPIFTPADTTNKNVTWSSSDAATASVSSDGTVTGVKAGTATITVTSEDGGFIATCIITIKVPEASVNLSSGKLPSASSSTFLRTSCFTDGDKDTYDYADSYPGSGLQWVQIDLGTSCNVNDIKLWHYFGDARKYHDVIVQLSNDSTFSTGVVTTVFNNDTEDSVGLGSGKDSEYTETSSGLNIAFNTVNARYARFYSSGSNVNNWNHYIEIEIYGSASAEVIHPTSVALNKTTDSIAIGATDKLTPIFTPADTTNKNVTWSSSDAATASVSSDGTVTSVKAGTATITATTIDGGFNATCVITIKAAEASVNLSSGKLPSASSSTFLRTSYFTDGDKDSYDYADSYPGSGLQWVQLDLGTSYNLNDIKLWHYFKDARKYHDIIVQLSNDSTFKTSVTTVFNNDTDNSAGLGLGAGTDSEYSETIFGKDVPFASVNARYIRFYSNGNSINAWNHYVEIEVYGK
jgi:SpoIID/LytB domain protein